MTSAVPPNEIDRRRHPRVRLDARTWVVTSGGGPTPGELANISASGCFVRTAVSTPMGISVSVSFLARGLSCDATGRVVRTSSPDGFGIAFDKVNDSLEGFIHSLSQLDPSDQRTLMSSIEECVIELRTDG